jgi:hypothetical protein
MPDKMVVNFIVAVPRSRTAAEMTRLVDLGLHFETKESKTEEGSQLYNECPRIPLPFYMPYILASWGLRRAFCLPPKEAIDLVLNASKATISRKQEIMFRTASHSYVVGNEWSNMDSAVC